MQEITTFEQAKAALEQHGISVEQSPEPKLWQVGAHRFDKGGVIQEARAVLERQAERAAAPAPRPAADHRWRSYAQAGNNALVPLREIRTDGGTQARAKLDEAKVEEYAEALGAGAIFPPVVVFYDGSAYWLADGFHRVAARRRGGASDDSVIPADVRSGTRRDAVLFACGANATHGLARSIDDKARAVVTLLRDDEWGQWSYREIARRCQVSHDFVGNVAERHGLTGRASSDKTYVTKHGTTATINTANIAAANSARTAKEPSAGPQPGEIHPLIAAAMEPEPTPATTATRPQRFILEPPAVDVPADLVLKGWQIRPPSARSGVYSGYNHRLEIGTHGYNTLEEVIAAARGMQEQIEDIEALDWLIRHDATNPRLLYATHPPDHATARVPSLYALHQRIMAWAAVQAPTPEIGTVAMAVPDTDLAWEKLMALVQQGYEWIRATYTPEGWRHLIVRADAPDMVRQHLTVAGIDNLLQMNAATSTTTAASASAELAPATPPHRAIVPQVLVLAGQPNPYQLPDRTIADLLGHTAEMVSCRYPDGRARKHRQENVYCLPHPEAAAQVEAALTRYQQTLSAIADELRQLGTYEQRLAEAGGINAASNPLTPTVIFAAEPDGYHAPSFDHALKVPRADRCTVRNHTAKMLRIEGSAATISGQQQYFVCPDDTAWERLQQHHAAAREAHAALVALLAELGTYQEARADGRYGQPMPAVSTVTADAPALDWQQVEATAVQLHVCNIQRNRDGLISSAFKLLRLAAAPSQIVLPLYPTDQAEALIAEIRVLLEQQLDQAAPNVGRLLRAVGRFVDQPPNSEEMP